MSNQTLVTAREQLTKRKLTYIPDSGIVVTDKIRNCQFKANSRKWKEGDTGQEVELELVPSHIEWNG